MAEKTRVIAIDGPAGAGKSSAARGVAQTLNLTYLDSGAMYRAVAFIADRDSRDPADVAATAQLTFSEGRIVIDGEDVSAFVRTVEMSQLASKVAADPRVREHLVARQRDLLAQGGYVAEGRDIGTNVAPRALLKIYLFADPVQRAERRAAMTGQPLETVLAADRERDRREMTRDTDPLRPADDAVMLDCTDMTLDEVVQRISLLACERGLSS